MRVVFVCESNEIKAYSSISPVLIFVKPG